MRALGSPAIHANDAVGAYWRGTPGVISEHLTGRRPARSETEVYYQELKDAEVDPHSGVADVFAALQTRGRAVAVFTGNSSRAAGALLRSASLRADVLIGYDLVSRPKPAPDGLLPTAEQLGVDPVDMACLGDSPLDLRTAAATGSHGAAAAWGHMYDRTEKADAVLSAPLQALGLLPMERMTM
ncbi:HAD family hydrolase [Streptomyces sp. NPDC006134]|uniref:HAD family hydrolase n=1 Tax=Streptomyces sp. NPDC006134 TaxID=3154467 RepID=UPI0033F4F409